MVASIRIQHLQWGGGVIAALGCLILGGNVALSNLRDFQRYDHAASALARFESVLAVAEAVSSERGPANSAMGPSPGQERALVAALAGKRAANDASLERFRDAFGDEIAALPSVREGLRTLQEHLASARALVDAVIAVPPGRRDRAAVTRAVEAMFAASDDAASLRDDLGNAAIRSEPRVSTEILLQSSASAMREDAGRLGSYAVILLTGGATREGMALRFAETGARVRKSWELLSTYAHAYTSADGVREALDAVRQDYFGRSWVAAHAIVAQAGPADLSAAAFTDLYVPGLQAPTLLRERVGDALRRRVAGLREAALAKMAMSGLLTGIVLAVLGALVLLFRNRLFLPLIAAREEIIAIVRGDLSEPARIARASREIGEMFDGLTRLRDEQRQKRSLEEEQRRLTRQLRMLSETDPLTGLLNRRALGERAPRILTEADRCGRSVGLILFDLDHFKAVNDLHGHATGDLVLCRVGDRLRPLLGSADLIARYGGEEFLVLLVDAEGRTVEAVAEDLRAALGGTPIIETPRLTITGSFGVAVRLPGAETTWDNLVSVADMRLYRAKLAGRDRVHAGSAEGGAASRDEPGGSGLRGALADAA